MENNFLLGDCEAVINAESLYEHYLCLNLDEIEDIQHPGQLCRLCANSTPDVIYIYGTVGEELNIASKINLSLPVMVKKTDPLPKQLCSSCVTKLNICHEFAESCLKAEEKLKALVKVKQFWSTSTADEGKDSFPEEKLWYNISADGKTEAVYGECALIQDSDPAEKTMCCPLCFDGKMRTCTEQFHTDEEVCEISLLCHTPETGNDTFSSSKNNGTEIVDTDADPVRAENVICELGGDSGNSFFVENNEEWWNGDSSFENAEVLVSTLSSFEVAKDLVLNLEDAPLNILCQLCGEAFSNVEQCLKHSLSHAEDAFYPCSLCGDTLQEHLHK